MPNFRSYNTIVMMTAEIQNLSSLYRNFVRMCGWCVSSLKVLYLVDWGSARKNKLNKSGDKDLLKRFIARTWRHVLALVFWDVWWCIPFWSYMHAL